jgi:hypothetical protein
MTLEAFSLGVGDHGGEADVWLVYVEDRHEATVGGGFALAVVRAF